MRLEGASVVFRCDASPGIGSGHVMRCLTLAGALREKGGACSFSCTAETALTVPALIEGGYALMTADEIPPPTDLLVVDHYGLDAAYETQARKWARHIVVLDDLANRAHDCDILLDQTLGREASEYKDLVPVHCHVMAGAGYALLNPRFAAFRQKAREDRAEKRGHVRHVLVSLGGTNLHNITGRVLEMLQACPNPPLDIRVVLGGHARHLPEVKQEIERINARGKHRAVLQQDVKDMARAMLESDLAIGAGGTTSWERCCLGLPAILLEIADNQKLVARKLAEAGAVVNLGWHGDVRPQDMLDAIENLARNPEAVMAMSEKAFSICDGLGVRNFLARLGDILLPEEGGFSLQLRPAGMDDARNLMAWRNDPAARAASLNAGAVEWDGHLRWLEGVLADRNRRLYIASRQGESLGTVRADFSGGAYELSWNVAPEHRGRGVGRRMLGALMMELEGPFRAAVKKDNAASARIAEAAGMVLEKEQDGVLYYYKARA